MKRTRYISLIIALLSILGIAAQQQQSQYALYNYRNDGDFNAWLNIDIDSITYSTIGLDSIEYDNIVTQEVWTPDSCYRIPLEAIDSIGFRAPEPVYKDNIFHIRQYHMPYILKAEGLTLSINNGIARDSIPAVGQIVISDVIEEPLPRGFSGRVLSVEETSEAYIITCEAVALTDIFERLLIVGRSESFTPEEIQQARRKASPDDTDWDGVVPFEFPKFSLNIPSIEGFVSNSKSDMTLGTISITPKFYVSYIADIRPFVHSYVKVLFENKSKVATEMHLKVSGESPVTETKRASVYLTKVPIPLVTGVLYGEVAVSGDLYLKGNLDLKASFSKNIYNGDEYEWSTSDFWNITHTRYDKDSKKTKKGDDDNDNQWQSEVTLSVNGSFGFGASLDLVLFAVSENTLEISNTTTVGPELSGSLQFSSEGLKDGTLYSTLKNTNVTFTPLKLSDDVKFNICNREFTLGSFSHSFGSKQFKLFPDFEPLSLLKKYTPGDYSQLPLGIYTKVINDVIPIIPLKLGIGRYDQYDNLLEESFAPDFYQYADEWDNKKLYYDMSSLPAGESYTFHPLIRIWGWKALQLKAMPQTVISVPDPMTLEQDAVVLQKFKTRLVAINGGWGDYSTSTSSRLICTSEIVNNNGKPYVKIATLRSFGSATVTIKDLRSGETKTILVTVSNDAVPEEFTLSEQTVSLQENETTSVLVTSGSGNYTAESSNENVATATIENNMITITAISIGSAVITVTDTETEETATIEVSVTESGGNDNGQELIVNGDFSSGNTGFTSDYIYASEPGDHAIWDEGTYAVGTSPCRYHSVLIDCGDHTTGTGNMLIANGSLDNTQYVWKQKVGVEAGKTYEFSAWFKAAISANTFRDDMEYSINGTVISGAYDKKENGWERYYGTYTATNSGQAEIRIRTMSETAETGNDFALDDISFKEWTSTSSPDDVYLKADEGTPGVISDESYATILDEKTSTKWCFQNNGQGYVIFHATQPLKVTGYKISTGNDTATYPVRNPKSWTLYGSTASSNPGKDGTSWEVIDTIVDDTKLQAENYKTYVYTLPSETVKAYRYFKWVITSPSGIVQVSEFRPTYSSAGGGAGGGGGSSW